MSNANCNPNSNQKSNVIVGPFAGIGNTLPKRSSVIAATSDQAFRAAPQGTASSDAASAAELNLSQLHRNTPVVTFLAQVQDWTLAWAGRISCTLRTSIGDIIIHTNRERLPVEIHNGSWIHAKLLLARSSDGWHSLISATQVFPSEEDPKAAWLPVAAYASKDYMYRLRQLLSKLESSAQVIFMGAMATPSVQQGFFARVSARDHHGHLGGLFQSSVQAAEIAYANPNLNKQERDVAALACLLFDLGKANDPCVCSDSVRIAEGLRPNPRSVRLLRPTLETVEGWNPAVVAQLRTVLQGLDPTTDDGAEVTPSALQQCITQSIVQSWQMDPSSPQTELDLQGGEQ